MIERIAFVSPPGSSAFMAELLAVVADAVEDVGFPTVRHTGTVTEVDDGRTACVVVPHEYAAVAAPPPAHLLDRMIAFGVEHPGTATFEASLAASAGFAAHFEINANSLEESRRRGVRSERFELGYHRRWDRRQQGSPRDIDVVFLGTADPRRLALLATISPSLRSHRYELFVPPHEPMTRPRPDFRLAEQKWDILARSRTLLNLHREGSTAFEWVRCLEAICNGAVVVTEPSTGLAPLVPGEDVIVAEPHRLGPVLRSLLLDPSACESIASSALATAMHAIDMAGSARRLADTAASLRPGPRRSAPAPDRRPARPADPATVPMAIWVPTVRELPVDVPAGEAAGSFPSRYTAALLDRIDEITPPGRLITLPENGAPTWLDVQCVAEPGDGPLALTLGCFASSGVAVHVALDGTTARDLAGRPAVRTVLTHEYPVGRGRCRNALMAVGDADLILVLDAGDQILPETLERIRNLFDSDPDLDVVYSMARTDEPGLVNALIPESRRLARFSYLTRGYVVRRRWLESLGGYATERALQELADHDFWSRSASAGVNAALLREAGTLLWPQLPAPGRSARERGAAALLAERQLVATPNGQRGAFDVTRRSE
ncbi:MAG: hypothetical protein QOK11_3064 [Pseudonocardiales bacterium]|nr:hypothetical protein [Pseudonocardiales bacterium]